MAEEVLEEEQEEEECPKCPPAGAPAWMATFADMATLLMAFFVLILSFAEFNVPKFKQISGSLREAFGVQKVVPVVEQPKGTTVISLEFSPSPTPAITDTLRQQTTELQQPELELQTKTEDSPDGSETDKKNKSDSLVSKLIRYVDKKSGNNLKTNQSDLKLWWDKINNWKKIDCLNFSNDKKEIKPQYAIQRLYDLTKDKKTFITTEVGQHQMWAAQFYKFEKPNRWLTSGGLGTMGYGFPAAIGAQVANPDSLVIDIAGDASILMNIQEMSTAVQYRLPVKIFILNNEYMGMVRQWQELLHGGRYSESYTDSLPDLSLIHI